MARSRSWREADYYVGGTQVRVATIISETYRDEAGYRYEEADVHHEHFIDVGTGIPETTDISEIQEHLTELLAAKGYHTDGSWDMIDDTVMQIRI